MLEARCAHFVIAHFNYCVLWSSASLAPAQHIYKLVSEIIVIAVGVVPMSKVEGSWISNTVIHTRMRITVQRLLPASAHGEFISHRMKVVIIALL